MSPWKYLWRSGCRIGFVEAEGRNPGDFDSVLAKILPALLYQCNLALDFLLSESPGKKIMIFSSQVSSWELTIRGMNAQLCPLIQFIPLGPLPPDCGLKPGALECEGEDGLVTIKASRPAREELGLQLNSPIYHCLHQRALVSPPPSPVTQTAPWAISAPATAACRALDAD